MIDIGRYKLWTTSGKEKWKRWTYIGNHSFRPTWSIRATCRDLGDSKKTRATLAQRFVAQDGIIKLASGRQTNFHYHSIMAIGLWARGFSFLPLPEKLCNCLSIIFAYRFDARLMRFNLMHFILLLQVNYKIMNRWFGQQFANEMLWIESHLPRIDMWI